MYRLGRVVSTPPTRALSTHSGAGGCVGALGRQGRPGRRVPVPALGMEPTLGWGRRLAGALAGGGLLLGCAAERRNP